MTGTWIIEWEREWKRVLLPHMSCLWGQKHRIRPALVSQIFGDGGQVIGFESFDTRPDYYLVRVDSSWSERNCGKDPICNHINEIITAIECDFGSHRDEYKHDNGRTYVKHWPFPAYHDGTGCCAWWTIKRIKP